MYSKTPPSSPKNEGENIHRLQWRLRGGADDPKDEDELPFDLEQAIRDIHEMVDFVREGFHNSALREEERWEQQQQWQQQWEEERQQWQQQWQQQQQQQQQPTANQAPRAGQPQPRLYSMKRILPNDAKEIQRMVRGCMRELFGLRGKFGPELTEDERERFEGLYEQSNGHCEPWCTAENFKLDLRGNPRSPWNISASSVFVNYMVEIGQYMDNFATRKVLTLTFFTRVKTLQRAWRQAALPPAEREHKAVIHRREERRRELFNRRWKIVNRYRDVFPDLYRLMERMGPTGMSDDESGVDEENQPYSSIFLLAWRKREMRLQLALVDTLYKCHRRADRTSHRGAPPRRRFYPPNPRSSILTHPPRDQPICVFDEDWLGLQPQTWVVSFLRPNQDPAEQVNFEPTDRMGQYVFFASHNGIALFTEKLRAVNEAMQMANAEGN
ncbi:hypothetical protein K488DRAFT_74217 [Vararia minispora EC-137]|uniref:Uncharacterized protein n=1 Tax=Vararia minispora EC-137 TaxID=1314806 RepID=A0ACB8Q8B5_9AGAM|nr:hypothetical protein K488DRAFT_74217 [Vararia minispora EC-137]